MFELRIRLLGICILLQLPGLLDVFRVQTNGIGVLPNQEMSEEFSGRQHFGRTRIRKDGRANLMLEWTLAKLS